MGVSAIGARPESEIIATVRSAIARGANFFDLAGGHAAIFPAYGKALQGLREKVYLQVHFGADYTSGEYGWTTELKKIQAAVKWQLDNLQTDYIDFGFIHCLDEDKDLDAYQKNGVLDDVLELCDGLMHGVSDAQPIAMLGEEPRIAKRTDRHFRRLDGGVGNIVYDPERIWKNGGAGEQEPVSHTAP